MAIKLEKEDKKYVDAVWVYAKIPYFLVDEKINKQKFHRKIKGKENVFYLKDLLREATSLNTDLLLSLRDGEIVLDNIKIVSILKKFLQSGMIAGTTEYLLNRLEEIHDKLKVVDSIKIKILQNLSNSAVESAQAFLMWHNASFVAPSQTPEALEKLGILSKLNISYCSDIIKYSKDFEHGRINVIKGKELDILKRKLEIFKEAIAG
jgi:hypothetical protein